jgi:copper resistance protein C
MRRMHRRAILLFFLGSVCLLAHTRATSSHAILVEATPAVNATVSGPEVQIKLRFNVRIDGSRSRLTLVLPDRTSRQLQLQTQPAPDTLLAGATGLGGGDYRLRWQVLASDGHITRGEVPFKVK